MSRNKIARFAECVSRYNSRFSGGAALLILFMTLLVTVDVLGRVFGMPTYVSVEMSGYMLVGVAFLGLAYTQRSGGHIQITMLSNRLSPTSQKQLKIATLIVSIIFISWLTWSTLGPVIQNYVLHRTSVTPIKTPVWIPWLLVPAGFALFAIELIVELIKVISSSQINRQRTPDKTN